MRKRTRRFLLLVGCCYLCMAMLLLAKVSIDTADVSKGIVHITYTNTNNPKAKVMIEKGTSKYTYDINTKGVKETYPLQLGNGEYTVSVLENTTGSKYKMVKSEKVKVQLAADTVVYLNSIQNVSWTVDSNAVKKAVELTKNVTDLQKKVDIVYDYVVKGYLYDYDKLAKLPTTYLPNIDSTYKDQTGICYDFSALLASMLRSQGIPSKLVKGYTPNANGYHAWNEVYDSATKEWVIIDATYDLQVLKVKPTVRMKKDAKDYQKVNEY